VRGVARAAAGIGGLVLALTLALSGGFFYLLATGPVSLDSLKPSLTRSLEERLGAGYRVSIGPTSLMRGPSGIGLGFGGIQIRDANGRTVVSAPGGRIGLDIFALIGLEVKVRRLELDGLVLKLRVRPDGALWVAAAGATDAAAIELYAPGTNPGAANVDPGLLALGLIDAMAGSHQPLDHFLLAHGHLEVENEALDKKSIYEDFALSFDRGASGATIETSARGPAGRWSLSARARDGATRGLLVEARDFSLDDILLLDAQRPPFESDMPISLKLDATLTHDGAIASLQGGFGLGAGYFKLADPDHEPFLVDEATGKLSWDAGAQRFRLDDIEALAGASHWRIAGWLAPPSPERHAWRGRLESHDSVFAAERPGEQPVALDDAVFEARYLTDDARFIVDNFSVHGPHLSAQLTAEAHAVADGATLKLDLHAEPSALADLFRLWPTFLNPEARTWCLEHFRGGDLAAGSMKIDWDAPAFDAAMHKLPVPPDSVHGEFSLRDAAVDLLPGVPPLTGLDATGFITGRVFSVSAKHGAMEFAPGRRMQASDIFFKIPDTRPAPVVASQAGAHVQGSADALADLLSRDAVKRYAGFAVDPADVRGQFQGVLALDLGLGKTVRPEDQHFRVEGALANLQLDKYLGNERFEQGSLDVLADGGNLKITGQGQINGLPAKVDLAKGPSDEGALLLNLSLDDAARAKMGITVGLPLTGPMAVRVKAPLNKSGADVEIDLARVEINSPEGATLKAAGRPGKATFSVKSGADGYALNAVAVDAGSFLARGTAQLGLDGAMQNAKFSQLRLYPGDDLKLDLQGGSPLKLVVRGASFDARNLVKAFFGQNTASGGVKTDVDIDAKVSRVMGANKQEIGQFELTASKRGGVLRTLQAKGELGQSALTARKDEAGAMRVRTSDAGALGKFIDLYNKLEGGSLDLTMQDTAEGIRGVASLKKFVIRGEAALHSLASSAAGVSSNRGVAVATAPVDSDAVHFDRLTATFTRTAGRMDLQEALIFNSEVGLTAQGFLDYPRDRVDINGTVVPAYQINSVLSDIPVLGLLLGGAKHEGVFGANYRISGSASAPAFNVSMFSAVTPGILRKLVGAFDGTTPTGGAPSQGNPQ
jgi:Protein of unknown function/AsmA-like C-terminal region